MTLKTLKSNLYFQIGSITPTRQSDVHGAPSTSTSDAPVSSWTESDVQEWLKKSKLDDLCDGLENFEGDHLQEMYKDFQKDPDKFERDMKTDYEMNAKIYLRFKVALGKLFKK